MQSEELDSDGLSASVTSFLANEKLMSLDSMNSDITGNLSEVFNDDLGSGVYKLLTSIIQSDIIS